MDETSRYTPLDDSDPACERTEATLAIYGIDPEIITRKLGIEPTGGLRLGYPNVMPSGVISEGRVNSWLLSSEDKNVISKDLRTHLNWLLDIIEPKKVELLELQQFPDAKMVILCVWWSAYGTGGPALWPEQMCRIANLNLECSIDFSYYGEVEEEEEDDRSDIASSVTSKLQDKQKPQFSVQRAEQLLDKTVLIRLNIFNKQREYIGRKSLFGTVTKIADNRGFEITLKHPRLGEVYWLPRDLSVFRKASPGSYQLGESGETVLDPDYISSWQITKGFDVP